MNPSNIPFNALIVGPTNSGKSRFVADQIYGPFRGKFDYIMLICPTFAHNMTYHRIGENDPRMFVIICEQHEVEIWLKLVRCLFEGTNTLIVLDDCAASKDVKGRTGQLVNLGFSARHIGISVWVLTQKITSITASFRENVAAIVLFNTPSVKTTKAIFDDYAGELSQDEYKALISKLKERKLAQLVLSLRHPYGVELKNESCLYCYTMAEEEHAIAEVMSLLEAEPSSGPAGGVLAEFTAPGPDSPALRERLTSLVSTGKAKDAIGVQLTHEQVKRLSDKDVEKYYKRYETQVGSKTTDSLFDSFIFLVAKADGMAVNVKDIDAYQKGLRTDYIIDKELSNLAGNLALKCGRILALANAGLITTKHIDLKSKDKTKLEEIPEQSSPTVD